MKGCGRHLLLQGVVLLLLGKASGSSSSHSLRNCRLVVSEPSPELPSFTVVGYIDDQPIIHYDSCTHRMRPLAPWMRKVEQDEPRFWDKESQMSQGDEKPFIQSLATLMDHFRHNSSTGLHTLQLMISCEVWPDGRPRGGQYQYAYDGRDFIVLDKETPTWTVFAPQAEILKRKLHYLLARPQRAKAYLEETCMDWLDKYLEYGNETLLRTEAPMVRVARKRSKDGWETLICQVYGFYPKEIEVTWMKDGEDRKPETLTGGILPNSDGTYHTWLSIDVDQKDNRYHGNRYRCRVEHDSLSGPQEWEEEDSTLELCVSILGGLLAALLLLEIIIFRSKLRLILGILVCLSVAIALVIFIFPGSNLGLYLGLYGSLLAAIFLLGILSLHRSNVSLHLGIFGSLLVASLVLGVFIFPRSNMEIILGILECFLAVVLILQVTDLCRSNWGFYLSILGGLSTASILLGIFIYFRSNVELILGILECFLAVVLVLQITDLLRKKWKKKKEERRRREERGEEMMERREEEENESSKGPLRSSSSTRCTTEEIHNYLSLIFQETPAPCPEDGLL